MKITIDVKDWILEYYDIAAELNKISGVPKQERDQVIALTVVFNGGDVLRKAISYANHSNHAACREVLEKAIQEGRILREDLTELLLREMAE